MMVRFQITGKTVQDFQFNNKRRFFLRHKRKTRSVQERHWLPFFFLALLHFTSRSLKVYINRKPSSLPLMSIVKTEVMSLSCSLYTVNCDHLHQPNQMKLSASSDDGTKQTENKIIGSKWSLLVLTFSGFCTFS